MADSRSSSRTMVPSPPLTVNRPDTLNALNVATFDELRRVLLEARRTRTGGRGRLTGTGAKAFVAGADIRELATSIPPAPVRSPSEGSTYSIWSNGWGNR